MSELKAVLLNQISHLLLKHTMKRMAISFALILFTASPTICILNFASGPSSNPGALEMIGLILIGITFGLSFHILDRQNKIHTFEADLHCIQKLGVSYDEFTRALVKLDWLSSSRPSVIHPETQRRILLIQGYLERDKKNKDKNPWDNDQKKAA